MDAVGGGLTSRMIFIYENQKYKTSVFPEAPVELYNKLQSDLERIHMMAGQFKVDSNFVDLWAEWYPAQEYNPPFEDPKLAGYIERRPNHVMKLSMILSASRSSDLAITGNDLHRAIQLLESVEGRMPMVFRGMGSCPISSIMHRVMGMIAAEGRVEEPHLISTFLNDADDFTMDRVLKTLSRMEYINIITREGRPREIEFIGKKEDLNGLSESFRYTNGTGEGNSGGH